MGKSALSTIIFSPLNVHSLSNILTFSAILPATMTSLPLIEKIVPISVPAFS
jgi:hypothetical protein